MACILPFRQGVRQIFVCRNHSTKHQANGLSTIKSLEAKEADVRHDLEEQGQPHATKTEGYASHHSLLVVRVSILDAARYTHVAKVLFCPSTSAEERVHARDASSDQDRTTGFSRSQTNSHIRAADREGGKTCSACGPVQDIGACAISTFLLDDRVQIMVADDMLVIRPDG